VWVHSSAPDAPRLIAETIAPEGSGMCRYFHVLGSDATDPPGLAASQAEIGAPAGIAYRRIILGFILERGGPSRWLTHEEISEGVVAAVQPDAVDSTVGTTRPWSARPHE
jgi:hypothetical protein